MADDDVAEAPVPAAIAAAWGLREQPVKGPRPGVSVEKIVGAAIRIADEDGLSAVSMSKVAAELGVTAMALYRHVGNKDELLILMMDAGVGPPGNLPHEDQGWRTGLDAWATGMLSAYRRRPWLLRIPVTSLPPLPNQVLWMEHGLRYLGGTALAEGEKLASILLLSNLVRGYGVLALDLGPEAAQTAATFGAVMQKVLVGGQYPALAQTLMSGALEEDVHDPAPDLMWGELRFGLDRVLDGIGALIESR